MKDSFPVRAALICVCAALALVPSTSIRSQGNGPDTTFIPRTAPRRTMHPTVVQSERVMRPTIGLVLSGGGARGLSSIGVLKAFEEADIPIDLIVGTSIGSIVGGLYASGYTASQLREISLSTNWAEVLSYDDDARRADMFLDQKLSTDRSILVLRFDGFSPIIPASFSTGQHLTNFLNLLALQSLYRPGPSFDNLRIPFRAVTTDIVSGKLFVFDEGDLSQALRASVSVPLLFSPVAKDSMILLDGGIISNMPIEVARREGVECVVAVDVTSPLRPADKLSAPWEFADQIIAITMQRANAEARLAADIVVRPDLGDHLSSDFSSISWLIEQGEQAGKAAVEKVRARLGLGRHEDTLVVWRRPELVVSGEVAGEEAARIVSRFREKPSYGMDDAQFFVEDLYATGEFRNVSLAVRHNGLGSTHFQLQLETYPTLADVAFEGVTVFPTDSVKLYFLPLIGRPLNAERSQEAIDSVVSRYRRAGLSLGRVTRATFDSLAGIATIAIDEGRIHRMTIRGTHKTRDYVVWRELPFTRGDLFDVSKIAEGLANIYSTNLFEQASITVEREGPGDDLNVVVLNLRERYTELLRLGLRVDNERGMQPWVNARDENFLGAGAEVGVSFSGGARNYAATAELRAVRIFDSYLTARVQGYVVSKDINTFSDVEGLPDIRFDRVRTGEIREIRRGGLLSFGSQLERLGDVRIDGRLERHQVYNIFNQPVANQSYNISSVRFGTRVDTQNKIPYPTSGVNLEFTYESALVKAPSAVGFTKLSFSYESFQTYFGRHTLHPRFVLGLGDDAVPTSEQFSLGGQESFYGFREDNARGRQLVQASLEYLFRLPIVFPFETYFTARYDAGAVWLRPDEIRIIDFQHAVGLGLGFDTPVGPVEVAVGRSFFIRKDLLERPLSLGPVLFYFSLGYRFQ